jgi:phosphate transport system substrate-binding protein
VNQVVKWISVTASAAALISVVGCGTGAGNNATNANNATNTAGGGTSSAQVTLNETGSSLLYPLFNSQWISAYKSVDPNVTINAASTGSGKGISEAVAGTVQIGASDAYMSNALMSANPSMLNIPLAVSAQQVMYNIPGLGADKHLNLSGDVLAQIYMGEIKKWNDPKIAALNPGVQLPNQPITAIRRSDASGDTFLFTQYLSDSNSEWKSKYKYSTQISWPAIGNSLIGATGNAGVVTELAKTKYSIGYVGISWLDKATAKGLGYAALKNHDGKFVLPTKENIQAAANAEADKVPSDERISLIDAPGANSYPIVNFEYAIVNSKQSGDMASALKKFLKWAIDPKGGNSAQYMDPVHFLPLPASVEPKSEAQINKIGG